MEEICYNCKYSHEWGYDALGWCYKYRYKKLVHSDSTCEDYEEPLEDLEEDEW